MQQNPQLLSCPPRDPPTMDRPPPLARRRKRLPTSIKPIYAPRHYASLAMNGGGQGCRTAPHTVGQGAPRCGLAHFCRGLSGVWYAEYRTREPIGLHSACFIDDELESLGLRVRSKTRTERDASPLAYMVPTALHPPAKG